MGISQSIALWLRNEGHNAIHLNDENLFKLQDIDILAKAHAEKRIILTTDMDFGQLLALHKSRQVSVIQFRTSIFSSSNIKSKLEFVLKEFTNELVDDFIVTVEDNRVRFRKLPI